MKDDYGYFGKGIDGYVHYHQFLTHDRQMLRGPSRRRSTPQAGGGSLLQKPWFWIAIVALSIFGGIVRAL